MHIPHPRRWAQERVDSWAVSSQQQARRNAMVASTVLAHRRAERMAVEEFLASRHPAHEDVQETPAHAPSHAAQA